MPSLHFTRRAIEAILPPESGQVLYRDTTLQGFGLSVGMLSRVSPAASVVFPTARWGNVLSVLTLRDKQAERLRRATRLR